jgi:hypothetical protein
MLTEEQRAGAYREMTDSTRRLVRATRDNARREQRVKPDSETHPLWTRLDPLIGALMPRNGRSEVEELECLYALPDGRPPK